MKRPTGPARTALNLAAVVLVMGSLAWASVPLYDWFCRVTGFGGTPLVADAAGDEVLDQTITIRFDASRERGMPWEVEPVVRETEIRIGETGLTFYEAHNPTDRPIAASASYNIAPYAASGFFVKVQCFCFEEQILQPGETVQMPVSYFVDPEIVDDRDGKFVKRITLSYTFHEIDLPEDHAALDAGARQGAD
jgi:cytochrome c oxidase assembly protein subunit 11